MNIRYKYREPTPGNPSKPSRGSRLERELSDVSMDEAKRIALEILQRNVSGVFAEPVEFSLD